MESKAPAFVSSAAVTVIFLVCSSAVFLTEVKAFDNMQGSNLGKLQKEMIFNAHFFAQTLGFLRKTRTLSIWSPQCRFLVTHSQHGELPKIISSDQDLTITVLNFQALSPVGGNKTYQQPLFQRECCVVCLNSPCHLPISACHPSTDAFPCAPVPAPPGIILDWDCSAAFRLLLPACCLAFSPPQWISLTFRSYLR